MAAGIAGGFFHLDVAARMNMNTSRLAVCWLVMAASVAQAAEALPKLKLEPMITVSGISSGGYMATQFHLAHAEQVSGVGIIAGGPYGCAENSLGTALGRCVGKADANLDIGQLVQRAKKRAEAGELAPSAQWRTAKVWLFHGSADTTVASLVSDQLAQFYRALVPAEQLRYVTDVRAGHAMPTRSSGNACTSSESPFINACQYDAAGELLKFLLGKLNAPAEARTGAMQPFDQEVYAPGGELTLADEGYLYVPKTCETERCRLHVVFHGCQQNVASIREKFVQEAGYNEWADSNRLVILYPQTKSSMLPLNPKGCWDWWGYTGAEYDTRSGNQIATVAAMIEALRMK